jgi:hypothetical protein
MGAGNSPTKEHEMQVVETKVSHRKTPPGACVEFLGAQGESIEVELRGDEYAGMGDKDVVRRARAAMSGAGAPAGGHCEK